MTSHGMRPIALPSQPLPQTQGTPQPILSASSLPPQSAGATQFVYRPQQPNQMNTMNQMNQMHHDVNPFPIQMNVDPELYLTGIHFHCFDSEKLFEDKLDRKNLEFMIKVSYKLLLFNHHSINCKFSVSRRGH